MNQKVILLVDDERIVLNSLKIELGIILGGQYTIEIAESGDEALEIVEELINEKGELPVIISDYIMPGMKGDELLKKVHQVLPHTQKILLSGQATVEGIGNSINHASLFKFINKPWGKNELEKAIKTACQKYSETKSMYAQSRLLEDERQNLEETLRLQDIKMKRINETSNIDEKLSAITLLSENILLLESLDEVLMEEACINRESEFTKTIEKLCGAFDDFNNDWDQFNELTGESAEIDLNSCIERNLKDIRDKKVFFHAVAMKPGKIPLISYSPHKMDILLKKIISASFAVLESQGKVIVSTSQHENRVELEAVSIGDISGYIDFNNISGNITFEKKTLATVYRFLSVNKLLKESGCAFSVEKSQDSKSLHIKVLF